MPQATGPCPEEADEEVCSDARNAINTCQYVLGCGNSSVDEDSTCQEPSDDRSCDCTETCKEGHVVHTTCTMAESNDEQICQCYMDGDFMGECRQGAAFTNCRARELNCCRQLYR